MPYKTVYVNPEIFMTVKGIKVYHTYKESEADDRLENWFTLSLEEDNDYHFDVRELSTWIGEGPHKMKQAIRKAIISGELKVPEPME